ncbi:MAG: hypothetical protein PUF65_01660 [Lachnospiraceae bacterium]|nr:hypothetical protein [Lachnospiraceae bacterium]
MGEQSSENYLDHLLDSVDEGDNKAEMQDNDFLTDIDVKDEDDFLKEFEEELAKDDSDISVPEFADPFDEASSQEVDSSVDDILAQMQQSIGQNPDSPMQELPETEEGEPDLSGMGDSDLMDMLSGDADLADLGSMLTGDSEGVTLDSEDEIGSFAEAEMKVREEESQEKKDGKDHKKNRKSKKDKDNKEKKEGGFRQKLSRLFFGEDEDEKITLGGPNGADVMEFSAENQQILKEFDAEDADAAAAAKKAEKAEKKKEKEKKKKEKQEAKANKPKKQKAPKPKKEKKPKEKDNTPPLPKGPVSAIVVMVGSLFALVLLGTNLLSYRTQIDEAKKQYKAGDYVEAYSHLQGVEIKEADEEIYNKLSVLAAIGEKYQDYLFFESRGSSAQALDSLVCAYGRCGINEKSAKEFDCEKEVEKLRGKIVEALLAEYNMTGEEAQTLYDSKNRDVYTVELQKKIQELGLE